MNHGEQYPRLRYATLCSGIECVGAAWRGLPLDPVFHSEVEPFACEVLRARFPGIPNLGDMRGIDGAAWAGQLDVLWASTPCTSFSSAGDRDGLDALSGQLALKFADLADEIEPGFVVWENVKNALSVQGGRAFGELLGRLAGENGALVAPGGRWTHAGYVLGPRRTVAWRLLDAQYGGVAQHRERVFLVACPRDGADPRGVLFERGSVRGDHPPRRPEWHSSPRRGSAGTWFVNGDSRPKVLFDMTATLKADVASGCRACVVQDGRVRRLLPVEWERLTGLEHGWTDVPWKGRGAPDSLRKSKCGNGVSVPDARWLGERIVAAARTCSAPAARRQLAASAPPDRAYGAVVIDPPWWYDPKTSGSWNRSGAHQHYPMIPDAEMLRLPVADRLTKDGVLFLWATGPRLDFAVECIRAWGLAYRGVAFVWVKTTKAGDPLGATGPLPTTVKPVAEFVLVASRKKRGRPAPVSDLTVRQIVFAPRGRHSEKPREVQERIEALYPRASKLEMFARSRRAGWDAWGDEVPEPSEASEPPALPEPSEPATRRQTAMLEWLRAREGWVTATELREGVGERSDGGVYYMVEAWERRGMVEIDRTIRPKLIRAV